MIIMRPGQNEEDRKLTRLMNNYLHQQILRDFASQSPFDSGKTLAALPKGRSNTSHRVSDTSQNLRLHVASAVQGPIDLHFHRHDLIFRALVLPMDHVLLV